jgi:hypothetical protein
MPDLAWRPEQPDVVAITPHASAEAERPVDGARDPDRKPLETADEPRVPVGFHEEVEVVGLDAEVEKAKAPCRARRESVAHDGEHGCLAERRKAASRAERDVYGTAWVVRGTLPVGNRPVARSRLAPGAVTAATP